MVGWDRDLLAKGGWQYAFESSNSLYASFEHTMGIW
jgi:hypothetical protein